MIRLENLHKLFTKEDSLHIHKILGFFCILHFGYRYALLISTGSMCLTTNNDMIMVGVHGVLSLSSLFLHIPSVRNITKPMIYPEFRVHSIIFGLRSVICCFIHYNKLDYTFAYITCYFTMITADLTSEYYKKKDKINPTNGSTMRNMPFDNDITIREQRRITRMHSRMQIGATLYMLYNTDTAFAPLFAIQLAAFLMTVVRKNIITSKTWHLLYSLSLWINYELLPYFEPGQLFILNFLYNIHCYIYFPCRINKYIAWISHFVLFVVWRDIGAESLFTEITYKLLGLAIPISPILVWKYIHRIMVFKYYINDYYKYHVLFINNQYKDIVSEDTTSEKES